MTVTDLLTGVTTLVDQESHYEALDGIAWTPVEHADLRGRAHCRITQGPARSKRRGWPRVRVRPAHRRHESMPASARSHEGLRFDPQGNLYGISESTPGMNGSGALYKFVPDRRGDLTSGQLYALKVLDSATRTGAATWVPLDRQEVQVNSDAASHCSWRHRRGRPENVEIGTSTGNNRGGRNVIYVAMTSEDLVIRVELNGNDAFVSNYVDEGVNVSGIDSPDDLALDPFGNLYICRGPQSERHLRRARW